MFHRQQLPRTGSRCPAAWVACLLVAACGSFTAGPTMTEAQQPARQAAVPMGARALLIEVSQVSGDVTYTRRVNNRTAVRTVTLDSKLQAGDTVHMDVSARCLLLFRNAAPAGADRGPVFDAIRPVAFRPEAPATDGDGVVENHERVRSPLTDDLFEEYRRVARTAAADVGADDARAGEIRECAIAADIGKGDAVLADARRDEC